MHCSAAGRRGGKARAKALSAERRSEIARKAALVRWKVERAEAAKVVIEAFKACGFKARPVGITRDIMLETEPDPSRPLIQSYDEVSRLQNKLLSAVTEHEVAAIAPDTELLISRQSQHDPWTPTPRCDEVKARLAPKEKGNDDGT